MIHTIELSNLPSRQSVNCADLSITIRFSERDDCDRHLAVRVIAYPDGSAWRVQYQSYTGELIGFPSGDVVHLSAESALQWGIWSLVESTVGNVTDDLEPA